MKRSYGIQLFINFAYGMSIGCSITLARESSSVLFALVTVVAFVGFVLDMACGHDKNDKK